MAQLISKEKIKAVLRNVLGRMCKMPLQDDKTEEEQYQDWQEKRDNAERQKRFRDRWGKECQIGTAGNRPKTPRRKKSAYAK